MKNLSVVLAASIIFISCNSGSNRSASTPAADFKFPEPKPLTNPMVSPLNNKDSIPAAAQQVTPVTTNAPVQATQTTVTTTPNTKTTAQPVVNITNPQATVAKGMNPEHGKPGHRCDIPVGAPLSTPAPNTPAQASKPAVMPPPVQTITSTPSPVQTAPGMNPPHGQPGHDCAIEVGKPLKKAQ